MKKQGYHFGKATKQSLQPMNSLLVNPHMLHANLNYFFLDYYGIVATLPADADSIS